MQQALENFNKKRTSTEAGLPSSSPKVQKNFYLPETFETAKTEIQCLVNWTDKKLPILVREGYKPPSGKDAKRIQNKSITTPMLPTKFCDLGMDVDMGKFNKTETNACYNLSVVETLPDKITNKMPGAQAKVTAFYKWLHDTVNDMLEAGWNTEGVWEKWKKAAEKEAKKELKKNPDNARSAHDIFVANAKTSMLSKYEDKDTGDDVPMYTFSTPYQMRRNGQMENNRPVFWKQYKNEYGNRAVKDVSAELPSKKSGLLHGSVIKFGIELNAYDLDTMYGIKAKLKPNILCIHLQKSSQRTVSEMIGNDTYFSDDDE